MEILEQIKKAVESVKAEFAALKKQKFASVMTSEGVAIVYEGEVIAAGVPVKLESGEAVPDGEYVLENNTTVTIVDGMVKDIKETETAAPASTEAEIQYATQEKFDEAVNSMNEKFSGLETKIMEFEKVVNNLIELAGKQVDALDEFSKQTPEPAAKPIARTQAELNKETQKEAFAALSQSFKNLKK
jgi:hypothetical protein